MNNNYNIFKELYDVTLKIKEMEPWKYFWDMDLITIFLPDFEEPICCSIMGRGGQYFGIGVYPGSYSLYGLMKISEGQIPYHQAIRYNNNLRCTFGNRDELTKDQYNLIKELGFKFRGKNNWVYFESNAKGYIPTMLDEDEAQFMLEIFKNLYMAIKKYIEEDIEVDFENGETLLRRYDEQSKLWYTHRAPLLIPAMSGKSYVIQDELLIARLKNKKYNNNRIEIDVIYLNTPIKDKKYAVPLLPQMSICTDIDQGMIVNQNISTVEESNEKDEMMNMLIGYVEAYGRPKSVYVRDELMQSVLADICEKLNIDLVISNKMLIVDDFVESFMHFGGMR